MGLLYALAALQVLLHYLVAAHAERARADAVRQLQRRQSVVRVIEEGKPLSLEPQSVGLASLANITPRKAAPLARIAVLASTRRTPKHIFASIVVQDLFRQIMAAQLVVDVRERATQKIRRATVALPARQASPAKRVRRHWKLAFARDRQDI